MLPASDHLRHHTNQPEHIEYAKWHMETRMRPRAVEWHGSEEGRKWHSERGKANGALPPRFPFVCEQCGEESLAKQRKRRFCSPACNAKAFRDRNPGYYTDAAKKRRAQSARTGD
jgi:hypothetical protein